jgi:hypothetical protein
MDNKIIGRLIDNMLSLYPGDRTAFYGFKNNPETKIALWISILKTDLMNNSLSLCDYKIYSLFAKMTQEQRNIIGWYLVNLFKEKNIMPQYPAHKIVLCNETDELQHSIVMDFNPNHLIVLINSLRPEIKIIMKKEMIIGDSIIYKCAQEKFHNNPWGNIKTPFPPFFPPLIGIDHMPHKAKKSHETPIKPKVFSFGGVIFNLDKSVDAGSREDISNIKEQYLYIKLLNSYIPGKQVRHGSVFKVPGLSPAYLPDNSVDINILYPKAIVHEMGHAIYTAKYTKQYYDGLGNNREWIRIFSLALGGNTHEIVDDSNYEIDQDAFGHPYDNGSEFFASSVSAYVLFADDFLMSILDPSTPAMMRKVGIAVFCFLRDKVFNGKVFTVDKTLHSVARNLKTPDISDEEAIKCLEQMIGRSNGIRNNPLDRSESQAILDNAFLAKDFLTRK